MNAKTKKNKLQTPASDLIEAGERRRALLKRLGLNTYHELFKRSDGRYTLERR